MTRSWLAVYFPDSLRNRNFWGLADDKDQREVVRAGVIFSIGYRSRNSIKAGLKQSVVQFNSMSIKTRL